MTTKSMSVALQTDAELVSLTLLGNRDAFGQIVSRYQSLICSLAYSATGSLGQSEDLAQETFISAWKHLGHLREHDKLRAWLCGIARNRINGFLRREGREPIREATPLEEVAESHSPEPLPVDRTISNEEQAILWRALERIPETYREPLVLFYREQQSIETVAASLDLTEDAVKQRLSRGRKLLQEQVLEFVEGALERTRPERAFTLAVLASLPGLTFSVKAAAIGAVAKGTTAKATGTFGGLAALLGPLYVLVPNYIAYRVTLAGSQSQEERRQVQSLFGKLAIITLAVFIPFAIAILWWSRDQTDRSYLSGMLTASLVVIFVPTIFILAAASSRRNQEKLTRALNEQCAGILPRPIWEFCTETKLLGLPLMHIRIGGRFNLLKPPVKAWIAIGDRALGGLFAMGAWAIAPVSFGGFAVGVLSFGALGIGVVALGGIALGVWPLFGGLGIGWQAFNECYAVGWNASVGLFALAHDHGLGRFVHAAQANTDIARQAIFPNPFFRGAEFVSRHWQWLNLFWIIPFSILWLVTRKHNSTQARPE